MGIMNVDFNNLRIQAMISYDNLCSILNKNIDEDGYVSVRTEQIQDEMDELRQHIGVIACVFDKNDENFKMVREKVIMAEFNPDEK